MNPGPYLAAAMAVLGAIIGGAITWGSMRRTVSTLSAEVAQLRTAVADFATVKAHNEHMASDLKLMREELGSLKSCVNAMQVDLARTVGWNGKGKR